MAIVLGLAAAAIALAVTWLLIRRRYILPTPADEIHFAPTPDGWRLALYRYLPAIPVAQREPVILCHGMLSNRFNVDLHEQASVARYLRERGFDAWVMELRGHGASRRASPGRAFDWNLDDYIQRDLPAAVAYVKQATGARQVHWFGHSMGGMILYGACAMPGVAASIRSAALSDAPASFEPLKTTVRVARLYGRIFPAVPPALVLPFLGPVAWMLPEIMAPHYGISDRRLMMSLLANAIIPWGSSRTLLQFCDMLEEGRFRSSGGEVDYEIGASRIQFPLLVLSAARKLMDERAIHCGFERAGSADKKYLRFSRAHGHAVDYTHSSLLVAPTSRDEVFPVIAEWFAAHSSE